MNKIVFLISFIFIGVSSNYARKLCSNDNRYLKFMNLFSKISNEEKELFQDYKEYKNENNYTCIEFEKFHFRGYLFSSSISKNEYFTLQNIYVENSYLILTLNQEVYLESFNKYNYILGGYEFVDKNLIKTLENEFDVIKNEYLEAWEEFINEFYINKQLKKEDSEFDLVYGLSYEYDACLHYKYSNFLGEVKLLPLATCLMYYKKDSKESIVVDKRNFLENKISELIIYLIKKFNFDCKINKSALICKKEDFLTNQINRFFKKFEFDFISNQNQLKNYVIHFKNLKQEEISKVFNNTYELLCYRVESIIYEMDEQVNPDLSIISEKSNESIESPVSLVKSEIF